MSEKGDKAYEELYHGDGDYRAMQRIGVKVWHTPD